MRFRILIAALLSLLAIRSSAHAAGPEIRVDGHITAAIARQAQAGLDQGQRTIRINSGGGDALASLALARDIRRHRATLIVDGICGGPCANYLFLAAARRIVAPGGLVIFSETASARLAMAPANQTAELNRDYAAEARQEKDLLAAGGVSPSLLLEPMLQLHPNCYALTSHDTEGKAYVNYRSDFVGWVPSRTYLERAHVRIEGFWPATAAQYQSAFEKAFPGGARGAIALFGPSHPSAAASLEMRLKAVPRCDTDGKDRR